MPITIILCVIIATLLFPAIHWWVVVIIGVALAPTDAALGQIVVQNKKIPERIVVYRIECELNATFTITILKIFSFAHKNKYKK